LHQTGGQFAFLFHVPKTMQTPVREHITVHVNRCLNGRGATEFCRRCLDGCPCNAIDITDVGIHFDASRCTECALCMRDCPTGVFSHDEFIPVDLTASAKGKKELALYCQASEPSRVTANDLAIPCHGLLDDRLLVALRSMGVEQLNLHGLDKCSDCPSREGVQRLTQTLESAPTTLKVHFPSLHGISEGGDVFPLTSGENRTGAKSPIARRDFLEGSVNIVAYAALSVLPIKLLQEQVPENGLIVSEQNECMIKHVPQFHRLACLNLQAGEISISDTGNSQTWFYEVRDHGICDACAICSLSCPTGALFIEDAQQTLKLNHQPSNCIGCGLCITLCPQQSLQFFAVDVASILDHSSHTLFACEKLTCRSCGSSFTRLDDDSRLCRTCEKEKTIRSQWIGGQ